MVYELVNLFPCTLLHIGHLAVIRNDTFYTHAAAMKTVIDRLILYMAGGNLKSFMPEKQMSIEADDRVDSENPATVSIASIHS